MKFLFASDSFKGTLSSEQIITLLDAAARKVFPDCETMGIPVADGGEGTIDAVISVLHGSIHEVDVHGPLMEEVVSRYGETGNGAAVIEMAAASGLPMVPVDKRDPRVTTTYGTGELIKTALDRGCRDITIAIGGSATEAWEPCVRWEFVSLTRTERSFPDAETIWHGWRTLISADFTVQ